MFIPIIHRNKLTDLHIFKRYEELPFYPNHLWQIESGTVKIITYSDEGNLIFLGLWAKGDIVGNFFGKVEPYHLVCLTKVKANLITFEDCPKLGEIILAHLEQMQELELIKAYKNVDVMLIKLLAWLGKKFGKKTSEGILIDLRLTHQELADILGVTRVPITKCLNQLEAQGIIKKLSLQRIIFQQDSFWHYQI